MSEGFGDFRERFARLTEETIPNQLRKAVGQACLQLMDDALAEVPKVPHDEGTLQGSGSVFVGRELAGTSEDRGPGEPARTHRLQLDPNSIQGFVGFNTVYAAYQHEGVRFDGSRPVRHYGESGTGAKFLERKMNAHRDQYIRFIAERLRRWGAGGAVEILSLD